MKKESYSQHPMAPLLTVDQDGNIKFVTPSKTDATTFNNETYPHSLRMPLGIHITKMVQNIYPQPMPLFQHLRMTEEWQTSAM